jgi:uncharacterized membrane protein YczE
MFYDVGLIVVFVVRIFLEILEMYESHSCAWMCNAIAIFCVGFGSCLYVRVSGGSSLNETSCAISASVRTLKVPVLHMTIGMISISALSVPCIRSAC